MRKFAGCSKRILLSGPPEWACALDGHSSLISSHLLILQETQDPADQLGRRSFGAPLAQLTAGACRCFQSLEVGKTGLATLQVPLQPPAICRRKLTVQKLGKQGKKLLASGVSHGGHPSKAMNASTHPVRCGETRAPGATAFSQSPPKFPALRLFPGHRAVQYPGAPARGGSVPAV